MCGIIFIPVGSQNVPGLWGCNFVGSVIGKTLINIKQMLAYTFIGIRVPTGLPTKATNIGTPR